MPLNDAEKKEIATLIKGSIEELRVELLKLWQPESTTRPGIPFSGGGESPYYIKPRVPPVADQCCNGCD